MNIAHRDIKPQNIVKHGDNYKIIDLDAGKSFENEVALAEQKHQGYYNFQSRYKLEGPKGTKEFDPIHFFDELLCKFASEPANLPKMVPRKPPKVAKKVPKSPQSFKNTSKLVPQSP